MVCSIPIRISQEVKDRLDELKEHPRETYNDILIKYSPLSTPGSPKRA